MDTPSYEEALRQMLEAANKEGDRYADEFATIEMMRAAAEAIGLREMMERLAVLEAAREDALDHGVSTHG